jgi:cell division ATPase FtsA
MLESLFKKTNQKAVLAVDFGSEAVKTVFFRKENGKIFILGHSVKSFENFGIFDASGLEQGNTKKIISDSLEEIRKQSEEKIEGVYLRLPSDILRAQITQEVYERKNGKKKIIEVEKREIFKKIFEQARKNISKNLAAETGIMPEDFLFITLKIIGAKIDGYETAEIPGLNGAKVECSVLATFLPEYYFGMIEKIFKELGLNILKISHTAELLIGSLSYFYKKDGTFLDIGGNATQIISIRAGKTESIGAINEGGKIISRFLAQILNLPEKEARIFKERYSNGDLGEDSRYRMKEIISLAVQNWFYDLKIKISRFNTLLPCEVFIFGGGSRLLGIKDILEDGDWSGEVLRDSGAMLKTRFLLISKPSVKMILPGDFKNIINIPQELNNPQFTTVFLQTI